MFLHRVLSLYWLACLCIGGAVLPTHAQVAGGPSAPSTASAPAPAPGPARSETQASSASSNTPAAAPAPAPAQPAPAPAPAQPAQAPALSPVAGPDLPSQYNTTFEQDPDVANGTVIISLRSPDQVPPVSLKEKVKIKKELQGTSQGVLLAEVAANQTIASTIELALSDPSVAFAEPDYILRPSQVTVTPNDPRYSTQWGMAKVNMPTAWGITTGASNVLVCVIDTGIDYNHPDLVPNLAAGTWTDAGNNQQPLSKGFNAINNQPDMMDGNGHGTHCAGVIGAKGNDGIGVAGVNMVAKMTGCKFLSDSGSGTTSDALECINWCVNKAGATISSNSWGGGSASQAIKNAIQTAEATNSHLFVAAAGNENTNTDNSPSYPQGYPLENIFSVGASTEGDARASFSNYGPASVDIFAPGTNIMSTVNGNAYSSYSGTSMACPFVAGAAAMLRGLDSTLTARQLKTILMTQGDTVAALNGYGAGGKRLNVYNAVNYVNSRTPGTPVPVPPSPPPPPPRADATLTYQSTLAVNALPFASAGVLDISAGITTAIDDRIAWKCGAEWSSRMLSTSYKKVITKIDVSGYTGTPPTTLDSGDCIMPGGRIDTISAFLACPVKTATTDFSACILLRGRRRVSRIGR